MSTFDDASLVFIPSGYKTSKAYSVKPTDGSGDLAFSRSNDTATRVGPDGLIQRVRANVLTYSQDFSNANWVGFDVTRTDSQTDPNGGTTSSLYTSLTNSANVSAAFATSSASPYTLSIYIRGTASGVVSLRVDSGGTAAQNNISYTTAWQRFTYTFTAGASTSTLVLGGYASFTTGEGIYVAFAQAELGDIATDYIATTSAAVSVGPVANVPRLDYLNSSCPRLLLEPQRTNNITYSEQLDNAAWTLVNAGSASAPVVTANYGISPDGTQNAERVQFSRTGTTSSDYSLLDRATISTAAGVVSFYGKSLSGTQSILLYYGSVGQVFTLTTEWQRFTLYSASTSTDLTIGTRGGSGSYFNGGSLTIDCLLWGFQKEAGSYATSYIPTLGAAVTRGADACSKTGISSLIGSAAGTIYVEFSALANDLSERRIALSDGTTGNVARVGYTNASNRILAVLFNGANQCVLSYSDADITQTQKVAFTWATNDFALFVNGVKRSSDVSGTTFAANTLTDINFNEGDGAGSDWYGDVDQLLLFKSRLSDSDLAALTA